MVHQKMHGYNMPHPKCKGSILIELAAELRHLKDEIASTHYGSSINLFPEICLPAKYGWYHCYN